MGESVWKDDVTMVQRESLSGDYSAEVVIIGAGMAGVLISYFLKQQGMDTVILEAARIGSGQTGNTTAKITSQHGLRYETLIHDFGKEKAALYAKANQKAIRDYKNIIKKEKIDCKFVELPSFLYSSEWDERLEREAEAARELKIPAEYVKDTELPFRVCGAVRFDEQAQFHPLLFLNAIAEQLTIFEDTKVNEVKENQVITEKGVVTGRHIVFATHYPFMNIPGYYFARMHQERSYVVALKNVLKLNGMYRGIGEEGLSLRSSGELCLLGGGSHRTGENISGGQYEFLRKRAKEIFPESREVTCWSAQDCIPADGIPYIGKYSSSQPDWYAATGFQKWGMTSSMIAADIICDLILEKDNEFAEIFSPGRITISESAKSVMQDSVQAIKGLTKSFFRMPKEQLEEIADGHGGVVEYDGQKVGVYKNEDGESFLVSTKCPHMGCQLEWNPDELSWDCPCHGSRFDYKGNLLDNPAQESISYE